MCQARLQTAHGVSPPHLVAASGWHALGSVPSARRLGARRFRDNHLRAPSVWTVRDELAWPWVCAARAGPQSARAFRPAERGAEGGSAGAAAAAEAAIAAAAKGGSWFDFRPRRTDTRKSPSAISPAASARMLDLRGTA